MSVALKMLSDFLSRPTSDGLLVLLCSVVNRISLAFGYHSTVRLHGCYDCFKFNIVITQINTFCSQFCNYLFY